MARISEFLDIEAPSGPWEDAGSTNGLWGGGLPIKEQFGPSPGTPTLLRGGSREGLGLRV